MQNNNSDFDKIYRENYNHVFRFMLSISKNHHLSEEIVQNTFVKAYESFDSIRDKSKISLWLIKAAYNLFIDKKRRKSSQQQLFASNEILDTSIIELTSCPLRKAEQNFMSTCVQEKLSLLPENYRAPLFLNMNGYSNLEIAEILGCSLANAKIRLHRARKKLRGILGQDCHFYYDERSVLC